MTTITIDRAVVEQALETIEGLTSDRLFTAEWAGKHGATITALRAALAQQDEPQGCATEEDCTKQPWCRIRGECQRKQAEPKPMPPEQRQRWEELAAMPQQAEPAQDIHGACPTHCCPVHGCKYMHDDCPVVSGAVQPVYPRNNGCESCADEAEPLNLSDRAVQRRLAAQWGYVPAAQAEPVEQLAELQAMLRAEVDRLIAAGIQPQRKPLTEEVAALTAQRDALLEALNDIANTDHVDAALDPQRAVRIARAAIKAVEESKTFLGEE